MPTTVLEMILAYPDTAIAALAGCVVIAYGVARFVMWRGHKPITDSLITGRVNALEGLVAEMQQKMSESAAPAPPAKAKKTISAEQLKPEDIPMLLKLKIIDLLDKANMGLNLNVAIDEKMDLKPSGNLSIKSPEEQPKEAQKEPEETAGL